MNNFSKNKIHHLKAGDRFFCLNIDIEDYPKLYHHLAKPKIFDIKLPFIFEVEKVEFGNFKVLTPIAYFEHEEDEYYEDYYSSYTGSKIERTYITDRINFINSKEISPYSCPVYSSVVDLYKDIENSSEAVQRGFSRYMHYFNEETIKYFNDMDKYKKAFEYAQYRLEQFEGVVS